MGIVIVMGCFKKIYDMEPGFFRSVTPRQNRLTAGELFAILNHV